MVYTSQTGRCAPFEAMNRIPSCGTACLLLALGACSSDPEVLTIEVTPGHETDAFSREPAITRIDVTARSPEGDIALSARSAPGGSFELGEVPYDRLLEFEVTGYDAETTLRVRGRSLGVVVGGLVDGVLPIFAQRIGQWARPPDGLSHGRVGAVGGVLAERYLMLVGGEAPDGASDEGATLPAYYDLLALGGSAGTSMPRKPETMLMGADGVSVLLIDRQGASWVDYDLGMSSEAELPEGLESFAEVAGGRAVLGSDGTGYAVGPTRLGEPSGAILVVGADRSLATARLAFERQGAAAAYFEGIGLVVAGGSETAPGLEVLSPEASTAVARPYPSDPTVGAALLPRGTSQHVVVLGGRRDDEAPPVRQLDALCTGSCEAEELEIEPLPVLLDCSAYATGTDGAVLLGTESSTDALLRAFSVDLVVKTAVELPLREERSGAIPLGTPHGMLAVVGGQHPDGTAALTVEMLATE